MKLNPEAQEFVPTNQRQNVENNLVSVSSHSLTHFQKQNGLIQHNSSLSTHDNYKSPTNLRNNVHGYNTNDDIFNNNYNYNTNCSNVKPAMARGQPFVPHPHNLVSTVNVIRTNICMVWFIKHNHIKHALH